MSEPVFTKQIGIIDKTWTSYNNNEENTDWDLQFNPSFMTVMQYINS